MCEFWDAGFQRPCSFRLCLVGEQFWLPHERKLIELIEGSKATQRRENLPQPTGWQAARYVSEAISALPVPWTHQLNCAPCENPGDKFTPAAWPRSHLGGHTHTLLARRCLWSRVPIPPTVFPEAVSFDSLLHSEALYLSSPIYTTGDTKYESYWWGDMALALRVRVSAPSQLQPKLLSTEGYKDGVIIDWIKRKKWYMMLGFPFVSPIKTSYMVLLKDGPITKEIFSKWDLFWLLIIIH